MRNILFLGFWILVIPAMVLGQTGFNYSVKLEPVTIEGLTSVHSYAGGQSNGKWIIIGGRLDGLHARQPFNAFPAEENNTLIQVVDPVEGSVWVASVMSLAVPLKEQLQSTNMQFYQDGDLLILAGGYGYSETSEDHITYPYLTVVDLPQLVDDIISGSAIGSNFQQIEDKVFAVTGGQLGKIENTFFLIGGHRFDGRYNPMNHPTFVQTYTDGIRKFEIQDNGGMLTMSNYSEITDPIHLHRRDYNLLPQIFPDQSFGYTLFSGVFQMNADLPFLYPIDINAEGHVAQTEFNQYLSNYHSATVALYESEYNSMHNLFFGGISRYYYEGGKLIQDDDVPFVKSISRVSRSADGSLEEVLLPIEMPDYSGTAAEFIINEALLQAGQQIIDLSNIDGDTILLGHIFGGIQSPSPNPFTFNDSWSTSASSTLFKVFLIKSAPTASEDLTLPGYHDFEIKVFPNPNKSGVFFIDAKAPEGGIADIYLVDTTGKFLLKESLEGLKTGNNRIEITLGDHSPGMAYLTVVLNGRFSDTVGVLLE